MLHKVKEFVCKNLNKYIYCLKVVGIWLGRFAFSKICGYFGTQTNCEKLFKSMRIKVKHFIHCTFCICANLQAVHWKFSQPI